MSVTLQNIADAAGLHKTTVSRALRNDQRISQPTREAVQEIARRLGYVPNPLISALMETRRHVERQSAVSIAFVTEYRTGLDPWLEQFNGAIKNRAQKLGFQIEGLALTEYEGNIQRLLNVLYARGHKGLIWVGSLEQRELQSSLLASHFAVVVAGTCYDQFSAVIGDSFHNVQIVHAQALKRGSRRPGLILCGGINQLGKERSEGAWLYVTKDLSPEFHVPVLFSPTEKEVERWIKRYRPDMILSNEPDSFPQLPTLLMDWIPQLHGGRKFRPGLDVRRELWGDIAVDLLASHLYHNERGVGLHARHISVPGVWVGSAET